MAYQPKNYRKFVATAATATLVASAIAPIASAADFKDVSAKYKDAVDFAVSKGASGTTATTFGTDANIKRGDAAVLLAKVLGLGTGAPNAGFKDVNSRLAPYVNALKAAGITSGKTETTFAPDALITRGELAIWIQKGFKLEGTSDLNFKDVNKNYQAAVQALVANGVASGTSSTVFGTTNNAKRGDYALFLYRADQATGEDTKAPELKYNGSTSVTVENGANFTVPTVTATDNKDKDVKVTNVITDASGKQVSSIDTKEAGTYKITYSATDAAGNKATDLVVTVTVKEPATPEVTGVSAVNAKQVQVKFNTAVDEDTVFTDVDAGTIAGGTVSIARTATSTNADENVASVTGQLSEDGKTLTLTAAGATYFNGTYTVTVSDTVKTTDNKAIKPFASTVVASDSTAPTVTGTAYDQQSNNVVVTLSEPVAALPDVVRLNGNPVAAANLSFVTGSNNTKVSFAKPAGIDAGSTATIYVAGAADAKGNALVSYNGNVTFTADNTNLSVASISQVSSNVAKVVFNKSLASTEATIDGALNVIRDGSVVTDADVTATLDATDTTDKTVLVTFAGTAPNYFYGSGNSKALTFVFADNVITDVFGKKLGATTQNLTMTKDVAGPQVVSSKLGTADGTIEVTFNEEIAAAGTPANITLRKDGVALNTAASATRKANDNKTLVITAATADLVAGKLPAGTYTVRLEAGAIADTHTNNNAVQTVTVSQSGETTDLTADISTAADDNTFAVTYSEDVTTASALNLANYKLDGAALPAGTDIYFQNGSANRTVVIKLPANSINIGNDTTPANASLAVAGVQTAGGKTVVSKSGTVKVVDNTAPTLQSASLVGNNIVRLTFNENLNTEADFDDIADILDDVQISNGTTPFAAEGTTPATATASVSGKDLIITVTPGDSNWSTVTSASSVSVKVLSSNDDIADANGVLAKEATVTLTK